MPCGSYKIAAVPTPAPPGLHSPMRPIIVVTMPGTHAGEADGAHEADADATREAEPVGLPVRIGDRDVDGDDAVSLPAAIKRIALLRVSATKMLPSAALK